MMATLPFHLISIFILGTPNNYWSRTVPISNTWGYHFEHMYFMMARSGPFTKGLKKQCEKKEQFEALGRYKCPTSMTPPTEVIDYELERQHHPISLLYASKCPDKYFGASPTCKLEHAMLYFLHSPRMVEVEWFIFMDDDNYVKPHALASFLFNRGLTISNMSKTTGIDGVSSRSYEDGGNSRFSNNNLTGGVETFVGCGVNHVGSSFSKDKPGATTCANLPKFCWAQPAIINRKAMELMKPAIEFQMLSKLQKYWGGSHDVVLGMMLWLFDLPVIPLHSLMHYCPITYNIIASGALQADRKFKQKLLYHKIQKRKNIIGQYDIDEMFHNISIREHSTNVPDIVDLTIEQEVSSGAVMSRRIDALIDEANANPLIFNGLYNVYWRSGRLPSEARDIYNAAFIRGNQTPRIFEFADCGPKPKIIRHRIKLMCPQHKMVPS